MYFIDLRRMVVNIAITIKSVNKSVKMAIAATITVFIFIVVHIH